MDKALKQAAALLGKKGGAVKVPKGFAKMTKQRRKEIGRAAARKRWSKVA